jgi:TetR/AcrR family transcriptional regulator, mexJK operon transcriptional repressor
MTAPVPPSASSDVDERRSARKRTAILEAATTLFLRNGYLGTSMDEIARLAAVSKQTVYKHFADKQRLFFKIVTSTLNDASGSVYNEVLELQDSGDVEADLRDLGRRQS